MQINRINKLSIKLGGSRILPLLWCRNICSHDDMFHHSGYNQNCLIKSKNGVNVVKSVFLSFPFVSDALSLGKQSCCLAVKVRENKKHNQRPYF
jgi:hypothetical protein